MSDLSIPNPTDAIDLNFAHYQEIRDRALSAHLVGGIPDYAFSLDQKLRQQLTAIRPVRASAQALVSLSVPISKQLHKMESIAVGPQQYPEIYAISEECARRLGIGIPQIFIDRSVISDAYTIASDDVDPIIVVSSHLIEVLSFEELKFVIGHECGHIHNLHGVYNTAVEIMTNQLAQTVLQSIPTHGILEPIVQGGLTLFFKRWSRCAEITCDRTGLICCGDVAVAQSALAKLVTGGGSTLQGINIQSYVEQIQSVQHTPLYLLEYLNTHPLIPKRLAALSLFADCETLYKWRPELRSSASARSKSEIDHLCEQVIRIIPKGH